MINTVEAMIILRAIVKNLSTGTLWEPMQQTQDKLKNLHPNQGTL